MIKPVLSIIIVSYNTADITLNCLKSIYLDKNLKSIPFEIIVVDNNSPDDSVARIKKLKKPIILISNQTNLGFGKANNQGIKVAQGNYLLFLNSDTIILHSAISQSLDWLSSHPESYGCTAQLLNQDNSIQMSGGYFVNSLNLFTWCTGLDDLPFINHFIKPFHPHTPSFYTRDSFFTKDHPQDWVTGAFMLLRKNVVDAVGGFDENYFMYGEEMEMCYRIHQKYPQFSLWYLVGPQIVHLGGASATNKTHIFKREYEGILAFYQKHHPRQLVFAKILVTINSFLRSTVYTLFGKNYGK